MKNLKFALFSMLMVLFLVTSCTNDEPVVQEQQETEESQSITTSLNRLSVQFDQNGNFTADNNPAGNVVFDFCFDFVYPITLSYNNGTTVDVNGLDDLVTVILSSTQELYINGIAFPFDVETYNENSDAIEIVTINNEEEFAVLIEDCGFDDFEECVCVEVYDPVCVEITDPNGETFTITYPNSCYAECDGFTEDDFVDTCEDDYYSNGPDCFTLNFPLDIIVNGDTVITINSEEELGNALYDVYDFNFVYPFNVTLGNQEVVTVTNEEDLEDLLEDCYDDYNVPNDCEACEDAPIDPVCIEYTTPSGEIVTEVFPNMCYAECLGYTEDNIIECEDDNNQGSVCEQEVIEGVFEECNTWEANVSGSTFDYLFNEDGTLEISSPNSGVVASGTWEIGYDTIQAVTFIILSTDSDNFTTVWFFINCDGEGNFDVITNGGVATDVESACD